MLRINCRKFRTSLGNAFSLFLVVGGMTTEGSLAICFKFDGGAVTMDLARQIPLEVVVLADHCC